MTEATSHAPGIPSWIDLATPDVDAARKFYGALFGWEGTTLPDTGGYTPMSLRGKQVAAISPPPPGGQRPPSWMSYVASADADATTEKVREAGGTVLAEPMQVMTAGRLAVYMDPGGAAFSIWQAGDHTGAQLVNEPGALCWTELQTRDVDGAKRFYSAVFGWGSDTQVGGPMTYTEWKQEGSSIGGMLSMDDIGIPAAVPAHWLVYLGAADCDATTARATELGGSVIMPPMDIQEGLRFSVVADPQGAVFGLLQMAG